MKPATLLLPGLCVSLVLPVTTVLAAQEYRPFVAPPEFAVEQWTTEDGLPQNSVNAIVQTPDGYLWVGTFGGLARFDGSSFTPVERTDSTGHRVVDRVLSLAVGPDSALWIGTEAGLLRRSADGVYETFTAADGRPHEAVLALLADRRGVVWFGTPAGDLSWYSDGEFGAIHSVDGAPVGTIESMVGSVDGTLWVNTTAGRVFLLPRGEVEARRWWNAPVAGAARMLFEDSAGRRWLGLPRGIARTTAGDARVYDAPGAPTFIVADREDGYWVGTINDGLFFFDPAAGAATVRRYALPRGGQEFRVRTAHVDSDGSVWVGTNASGLLRTRRNLFATYTRDHGLSHDVVTAVLGDPDGTMWVATNCGGVNEIDPSLQRVRTINPRSRADPNGDPCVFALARGPGGSVLQGSYGGGVSELPRNGRSRVRLDLGLPDSVVLALLTGVDGALWVGMSTGGLAEVRDGRLDRVYTTSDGLPHDGVRALHESSDGSLWIGTLGGLSRLRDERITTYTTRDGLSASHVRAIHEGRDGTMWIGTYGGGLNHFRHGEFTAITRRDGLAEDVVSAIIEDAQGSFWLSGNRGISRVERAKLVGFAEGRLRRVHAVLYGRGDGLRNPETNGGFHPAAWKDARGHIWFPTVEGVVRVDPSRARRTAAAPSVRVEEVVVDGEVRPVGAVVEAGPRRPNVEFTYAGLSLSAPEHVTFRYRLQGFDEGWIDAGTRRVAYYPGLPPGTYRFTARAANRHHEWGEPSSALELHVTPPFWSAWWVRLGGVLGFLTVAGGFIRRRDVAARRQRDAREEFSRRLIESQEHERLRLAGELHDGIGQDLMIVRNRVLLALRAVAPKPEVRAQLDFISDVVSGSLESIRELVHNLTPHQLRHLGLSAALLAMAETVDETSRIGLDIRIDTIDGLLPAESEIALYRIVQEALNNIVRHSGAHASSLHVRRAGDRVRVTVRDEGCGFRSKQTGAEDGAGGFGLSGMQERSRILGGRLRVRSMPGRGTRLELSVPIIAAGA